MIEIMVFLKKNARFVPSDSAIAEEFKRRKALRKKERRLRRTKEKTAKVARTEPANSFSSSSSSSSSPSCARVGKDEEDDSGSESEAPFEDTFALNEDEVEGLLTDIADFRAAMNGEDDDEDRYFFNMVEELFDRAEKPDEE